MRAFCPHCGRRFYTKKGLRPACPQHRYASTSQQQFEAFRARTIAQGGTWRAAPKPKSEPEPKSDIEQRWPHWPKWRIREVERRRERREARKKKP